MKKKGVLHDLNEGMSEIFHRPQCDVSIPATLLKYMSEVS